MAEEIVKTVPRKDLPVEQPITIIVGDTFRSDIYRHLTPSGVPIDTGTWVIPAKLFKRPACGSDEIIDFTVEQQPGPKFGYRLTLTDVQTGGLECDTNVYRIPTFDGTTHTTYFDGPATVKEG